MPVANAGPDQELAYTFETILDAEPLAIGIGEWSVVSGSCYFADVNKDNTYVNDLTLGINELKWTVTNGVCPAVSDNVVITVLDLVIPTLITPNGDSYNQTFKINGILTLGKTNLIIFDRRGLKVYESKDYKNDWNGVDDNGHDLPDDTYFYVLKSENGKSLSGFVVIRR